MPVEKFPHPAARIGGCLLVVFQPVTKHGPDGLELRVVETVVNAGVDDLLDRHPVGAPGVNFLRAVCRRRKLVEGSNKNERGDHQAPHYGLARGIKRNHCTKPQIAWRDEQFERIRYCNEQGDPTTLREADCGHSLWVDEGLASQEGEGTISIRRALAGDVQNSTKLGSKAGVGSTGVLYTPRGKAIDEQNDITPANKFIDQFSPCRDWHAGTAVQPDDRGKRACSLGLGQIPLYAAAQNEPARNVPLSGWRGTFKLYAL